MSNVFTPPIIEDDPAPYTDSILLVKAFQRGEDGKLYDMYHPTQGYEIGNSVRKGSVTMLSASPSLEDAQAYNKYNPTKVKPVFAQIQSDDYYFLGGSNPEVRMNRYQILRTLNDD